MSMFKKLLGKGDKKEDSSSKKDAKSSSKTTQPTKGDKKNEESKHEDDFTFEDLMDETTSSKIVQSREPARSEAQVRGKVTMVPMEDFQVKNNASNATVQMNFMDDFQNKGLQASTKMNFMDELMEENDHFDEESDEDEQDFFSKPNDRGPRQSMQPQRDKQEVVFNPSSFNKNTMNQSQRSGNTSLSQSQMLHSKSDQIQKPQPEIKPSTTIQQSTAKDLPPQQSTTQVNKAQVPEVQTKPVDVPVVQHRNAVTKTIPEELPTIQHRNAVTKTIPEEKPTIQHRDAVIQKPPDVVTVPVKPIIIPPPVSIPQPVSVPQKIVNPVVIPPPVQPVVIPPTSTFPKVNPVTIPPVKPVTIPPAQSVIIPPASTFPQVKPVVLTPPIQAPTPVVQTEVISTPKVVIPPKQEVITSPTKEPITKVDPVNEIPKLKELSKDNLQEPLAATVAPIASQSTVQKQNALVNPFKVNKPKVEIQTAQDQIGSKSQIEIKVQETPQKEPKATIPLSQNEKQHNIEKTSEITPQTNQQKQPDSVTITQNPPEPVKQSQVIVQAAEKPIIPVKTETVAQSISPTEIVQTQPKTELTAKVQNSSEPEQKDQQKQQVKFQLPTEVSKLEQAKLQNEMLEPLPFELPQAKPNLRGSIVGRQSTAELLKHNRLSKHLDLGLSDEEDDQVHPLKKAQQNRNDGKSAALLRLQEKKQKAQQNNRPVSETLDIKKFQQEDQFNSLTLKTEIQSVSKPVEVKSTIPAQILQSENKSEIQPTDIKQIGTEKTVPPQQAKVEFKPMTLSNLNSLTQPADSVSSIRQSLMRSRQQREAFMQPEAEKQKQNEVTSKAKQENEGHDDDPGFIDFSQQRQALRRDNVPSSVVDNKKSALVTPIQTLQQVEEVEMNSSESSITDKEFQSQFTDKIEIDSDDIEELLQQSAIKRALMRNHEFQDSTPVLQDMEFFDFGEEIDGANADIDKKDDEENDFMKLIMHNENMFRTHAEKKLKDQRKFQMSASKSLQKYKDEQPTQTVIAEPQFMPRIGRNFGSPNITETCIAISQDIILVGTSAGLLFAYNILTEEPLGVHKEDGKDFIDNAITCIDIHQLRPNFCVIGFARGQMALINVQQITKTVKLIKDHHKKPVVSVKFCDWVKEKPHLKLQRQDPNHKCKECQNVEAWMFMSCDIDGRVIQNTVTNAAFGLMYANDHVLIDPIKQPDQPIYQVIAPRMSSNEKPLELDNDSITLVAIGSAEKVVVIMTPEKQKIERISIEKPKRYSSHNSEHEVMPIENQMPILSWGFGRSPMYNFQRFAILAIAWGPLIQLVVFRHISGDPETKEDFDIDGYYIIAPGKKRTPDGSDVSIQSMCFLDESLLAIVASNSEVRVVLTEKFKNGEFQAPQFMSNINLNQIDSRERMLKTGSDLDELQLQVEMEQSCTLGHPFIPSRYGSIASQTLSIWDDRIMCLTSGGVYQLHHLNWIESLGNLESSVQQGSWIEIFAKALEIYLGKVKGLRMKGGDSQTKNSMKDQLKQMIDKQVVQIIQQWKMRVQEDMNSKFQTLIRTVIEFCVDIAEPTFLFNTLLVKFHNEGKSMLFTEELKPYILSGHFSECLIPEATLSEQILKHHIKLFEESYSQIQNGVSGDSISSAVSSAENIEKLLMNFKFDACSQKYKLSLIDFCKKYHLTSGLMYLCLNTYGEFGSLQALIQLKDFYMNKVLEEIEHDEQRTTRDDLHQLNRMPANFFDRVILERSSCYLGLKLLWTARQFLVGKKFPSGIFNRNQWHVLCHDVIELITQEDFISLCTDIDAAAYFQIVSIIFTNPSAQYTFITDGRPDQTTEMTLLMKAPSSITHDMIVQRISAYYNAQGSTNSHYLHYLCFIASIAGSYGEKHESTPEEAKLYFDVAVALLKHSDLLVGFNKDMLNRRMTNKQMFRRLSNAGNHAPDEVKHLVLSETMLIDCVNRCRAILLEERCLNQLLAFVEETNFQLLKLTLYDLAQDYLKCLRLVMMQKKKGLKTDQLKDAIKDKGFLDGFNWITEKHARLELVTLENTKDALAKKQLQNFEKEVLNQSLYLVKHDTQGMIKLCDQIFKSAHQDIIEQLKAEPLVQLHYIKQMLELKRQEIKDQLTSSGHTIGSQTAQKKIGENQKWMGILCMHVRLICVHEPTRLNQEVKKIIKDNFYPMEECLKICNEFKQTEASALLNKKVGNYSQSITLYLELLKQGLNYQQLKKELYYLNKENQRHLNKERESIITDQKAEIQNLIQEQHVNLKAVIQTALKAKMKQVQIKDRRMDLYLVWVEKFGPNIALLDHIIEKIQKICKNHPKEVLTGDETWKTILIQLFKIQSHPSLRTKIYCKKYIKLKLVEYCRVILYYVPFTRIISEVSAFTKNIRFKAVKELVNDVFADKSQELEMCINADTNQCRDLVFLQQFCQESSSQGVAFGFGSLTCGICNKFIRSFSSMQKVIPMAGMLVDDAKIFDCIKGGLSDFNHSFHQRCIKKIIIDEQEKQNRRTPGSITDVDRFLRCPVCYPQSKDFTSIEPVPLRHQRSIDSASSGTMELDESQSDSESRTASTQSGTSIEINTMFRARPTTASARDLQKQINHEKAMKQFEQKQDREETLYLSDFKMLD